MQAVKGFQLETYQTAKVVPVCKGAPRCLCCQEEQSQAATASEGQPAGYPLQEAARYRRLPQKPCRNGNEAHGGTSIHLWRDGHTVFRSDKELG